MSVNFKINGNNFWVGMSSVMSRRAPTRVIVNREIIEAQFSEDEKKEYYRLVPRNLGGTAQQINFRAAIEVSYTTIYREIYRLVYDYVVKRRIGVFVVARNRKHQQQLRDQLLAQTSLKDKDVYTIGKGNYVNLNPSDPEPGTGDTPWVVITTPQHAEGYNLSRYTVMITGVYFSNQATRTQLEGRINRINQIADSVYVNIVHAGLLSYIFTHYERTRSLSQALKGFSKEMNLDINYSDVIGL